MVFETHRVKSAKTVEISLPFDERLLFFYLYLFASLNSPNYSNLIKYIIELQIAAQKRGV